jgi:beta-alanine--pyruvate transaminase
MANGGRTSAGLTSSKSIARLAAAAENCSMPQPNSLDAFWMPFTPNRAFKADPRMVVRAEGMHYFAPDGRAILDATAGLWCVAAGHCRPRIVDAIRRAAGELDYATNFNLGSPSAFEFANRLGELLPENLDRVFFTNSGSESADTALKIALAYQKARGKPGKYRLIGRERG